MTSKFYRLVVTGGVHKREAIPGDQVCVDHAGVVLTVNLKNEGIEIRWGDERDHRTLVPFVPTSYQTVLVTKAVEVHPPEPSERTETPAASSARIRRRRA